MTPSSFRLKSWLRAGAGVACLAWLMGGYTATAVAATARPQYTGDLIIKWRDDTSGTRKTLSAAESSNRLLSVAQTAGSTLQVKRTLATEAQLMHTGLTDAASIEATAAKIAQDARVAYAVPDRILRPNTIPNDPLFATQNNLASPTLVPGGINAAAAWSITQGSGNIVVAVVDTGYTDHPDLVGKILPGYNFISDPARAGNTFGRGTDAHDLGDGVTSAQWQNISGCTSSDVANSSWHGTEVSSVLAANTNNALDIAGVGWNTQVVPVRVSGKCGALLSDTVDGMLWAGGIAVTGAPTNANPARVVNVSLGSTGACSAAEQDAVNRLASIGTTVVAASGNEAAQSADAPANCTGAIAVTANVDSGENASYANVGPQVALSAPGGGCANSQATSSGCTGTNSSWHGTEVSSVLAANTNNALDIAGVGWNTQVVPVRVSGKCGALLSDTVDGMLWAGGIAVTGAPTNANPARVVNVSLGSTGACSAAEQDAVNRLASIGTTVVAASGNEAAQSADAPANCTGAIAVTANVDSGENASYANVGPQVALSAPGGGCANSQATSSGCTGTTSVIQADSNNGAQTLGSYVVKSVAGTSFSTPEVAGTIALMLSVQPQLSNTQILAGLQQTARPHPSGTYCAVNTGVCGAGLLDTAGAVGYAQRTTPAGIGSGTSSSSGSSGSSSGGGGGGGGGAIPLVAAAMLLALGLACRRKRTLSQ